MESGKLVGIKRTTLETPLDWDLQRRKLGITWRGLIMRGLKSFDAEEGFDALREKVEKLSNRLNDFIVKNNALERELELLKQNERLRGK